MRSPRRDGPPPVRDEAAAARVQLVVLSAASDPGLVASVLATRPLLEQERFAVPAAETLAAAAVDPARTPFAVLAGDRPVGFGILDRGDRLSQLLDDAGRAVLLRAFYLDASAQGRGLGAAAARAVRSLAPTLVAAAELVVLTVHADNQRALRAYARAGYVDTGGRALDGGGQQELVLAATVLHGPQGTRRS